jgi:tRNA threonylcarbamoyladenosine modification (KEOPS) complex Cgi121 subunit
MLQYLKEYGQYIEITGYRGIAFSKAEAFLRANRKQIGQNVNIQFFNADLIATQEHLYFAILNALQAFKNKTNHSKSSAMETLLYASAQRQIQKAIGCCGIKLKTKNMAVAIIGDDPEQIRNSVKTISECIGSEPDETVLDLSKGKETRIRKVFKITPEELETQKNSSKERAIANLVIERVALLSTQF